MKKVLIILFILFSYRLAYAQTRVDYFMNEAARCMMNGQVSSAADLYSHCLEINPNTPEAIFQLGRMKFYLGQDSLAFDMLYKALEQDSCNCNYIETLVSLLVKDRKYEEALPLLERMSKLQSNRTDVFNIMAQIYSNLGFVEDAIHTYDRLEILEGKMASLSIEKFNLYMEMGDSVSAFQELQQLCAEYPADLSYRIHMGYQYQLLGDYDKAMQIYEEVKKSEPANVSLQMAMLDYYKMNGQDSLYVAVRDSILYSPETESGKKTLLLQNMVQTSPKDSVADQEIIQRFEHILGSDSTNVEILTLYALFLEYREKSPQHIASLMHSILNIQPENEMALQWLTTYYVSNADILSMEEMCRRAINYYPSNLTYYYFLSYALMNAKNYEGILELLERGLRLCSEETKPQLISEVFTQRGDAYYALGEYDKAFLEYDSALVYNKDNILCLNNYAYFLSLRNEQLDRAEEMSYRTVKLEPNNPTYLDTYAWILFMQQDYIGAQSYMDRVVPRDSTEQFLLSNEELSGVLLEHAGDIAWMNGETERAVQLWRLALQKKDDDVTPKLRKKAKKKKYYK